MLSRQIQHSLSTAAATVVAAEVAVSMAVVEAEAFTVVAGVSTVADLTAAGGLLVEEEVTTKAAAFVAGQGRVLAERAAVMEGAAVRMAGMELGAVSG
ncbi:MAG: hypothetical protein WCB94_01660 [Terriglobales bacterium]